VAPTAGGAGHTHKETIMNTKYTVRTGCACLLAALAGQAHAQCVSYQQLIAGDVQNNAFNGVAAAMDGQYVLLGAEGKTVSGSTNAGEVYAYAPISSQWGQVAHFFPNDPQANAIFGASVAMGGGAVWSVVGAPGAASNTGAAYVFQRNLQTNLWSQSVKLSGISPGDHLGASVGMNKAGTIMAVAAPYTDVTDLFGTSVNAGEVLVYSRSGSTWTYEFPLHQYDASIRHDNDYYGSSVAADGNNVVVGVPYGDGPGKTDCGYIHIWTRSAGPSWTGVGEIYAPDAQATDYFGSSVAISGNFVAVGSPNATIGGLTGNGAVYIFRLSGGSWILDGKVNATDGLPALNFGEHVAISGNELVVGTNSNEERTYIFRRTITGEWVQDARFQVPGGGTDDAFGCAVAIDGTSFVSGAWGYDTPNFQQPGTAYVFDVPSQGSDTCDGATVIGQGTYYGCTSNCTVDGSTSCGVGAVSGPDIWYEYFSGATGMVTIDTQGSTLDTVLSIHTSCSGNSFNTIACNDDFAPPQRWSQVTFPVTQGSGYLIRVAGYGGASGYFQLNIGGVAACYANCDGSTSAPVLNVADFTCFLQKFAQGNAYANCDGSTTAPVLNVADFTCFLQKFAQGCQ
jgi:FG-GAP repeat